MYSKILKANPFRDAKGHFAKAPYAHIFSRDMQKQYAWLQGHVKRMRLPSVDHLVEQHPAKFVELAGLWRQRHPLPAT